MTPDWDETTFASISSVPERAAEPRNDRTGWERPAFCCGCGRGCGSWPEHHERREAEAAKADREDFADEYANSQEDPSS